MPLALGLPFSLALVIVSTYLGLATGAPLGAFMVIGSALWVYFDSKQLELSRYRTGLLSPEVVTIGCFLLWIIAFPWYLSARHRIKHGTMPLKEPPPGG